MITRRDALLAMAALACAPQAARAASQAAPTDEEVLTTLKGFVDVDRRALGVVVGLAGPTGVRIIAYGAGDKDRRAVLDGDSVFEIGSVTKIFTATALAQMVRAGSARLDQPVSELLPAKFPVPTFQGQPIKLVELATHSAGLPGTPSNMMFRGFADPYPYSDRDFIEYLSQLRLDRAPGVRWEYSNVGASLLAHALAARSARNFEAVLKDGVLGPMGMRSSAITLDGDQRRRLVRGHDRYLRPVGLTQMPGLQGAGSMKSTAADLLRFLQAAMLEQDQPIHADTQVMLSVPGIGIGPGYRQALGWMVQETAAGPLVWHDGGSAGFSSFIGFSLGSRLGAVVLTNASSSLGVSDLGRRLLLDTPLARTTPPAEPALIGMHAADAERCLGRYRFQSDGAYANVIRNGRHFFYQADGKAGFEIHATAPRDFILEAYDIELSFRASRRQIDTLVVRQGRTSSTAVRV